MSTSPGLLYAEDNVEVASMNSGYPVYGGYFNGRYANMAALRDRFAPAAKLLGVAVTLSGSLGADACDCEPGTMGSSLSENEQAALAFLQQWKGGSGVSSRPIVYVQGSWAQSMQTFLAAYGWDRSRYFLWTAHYSGLHLCGPATCRLVSVAADMTQYATGKNDFDVLQPYVVNGGSPTPPSSGSLSSGSTGAAVKALQKNLNRWQPWADDYPALAVDGDFGGQTEAAVRGFQQYAGLTATGAADATTQARLDDATPKTKPSAFTYDVPTGLVVKGGRTSFRATWNAPADAGTTSVPYGLYVYQGTVADRAHLVKTYPRIDAPTKSRVVFQQDGSLPRGESYILHVVAGDGATARPWVYASASFKTG